MKKRNLIYISFITFLILGIYVSFTSHSPDKIFAEEPSTKNYNKDIFLSKLSKLLKIDKSELEDAIKKTKSEMIKEKSAKYVPSHKTHLKTEIEKALKNGEITPKQAKFKYMSINKNISDMKKNIHKLLNQGKITQEEAEDKIEFIEKKFSDK